MDFVKKFLHVEGIIGQGAFGRVLLTSALQNQTRPQEKSSNQFAVKCVHPILRPSRLASELRYLRDLGGQCNVVQMHTAHFFMGSLYIVMELIEHDKFVDIVAHLDYSEIVNYMKNLFIALEHVHSRNIMHRDIKPANFLYNRKNKKFLLVDFGLAQQVRVKNPTPNTYASSIKLSTSPKTPTSINKRLPTNHQLFPEAHDDRNNLSIRKNLCENHHSIKTNGTFINLKPYKILQSPVSRLDNLTSIQGKPMTPNMSTKRQFLDTNNDFNSMLKKLRVSNNDEAIKEPVKLTVGAYESPVTHNDSMGRRNAAQATKFSTPTIPSRRLTGSRCDCRGKAKTCNICLSRPDSSASRSGTPGHKAPEILLRYAGQTTAIDIWSAGIIFACLLSGHSPFLRDSDDIVSLAEIISLLGSRRLVESAKSLGIRLTVKPEREGVDLAQLCQTVRYSSKDKKHFDIPGEAFDLLNRMLDPNPAKRITASEALKHSWFSSAGEL